jgi:hypothetical protein
MGDYQAPSFGQSTGAGWIYREVLQSLLANHQDGGYGSDFMRMGSEIQKHGSSEFGLHYPTAQAAARSVC